MHIAKFFVNTTEFPDVPNDALECVQAFNKISATQVACDYVWDSDHYTYIYMIGTLSNLQELLAAKLTGTIVAHLISLGPVQGL